MTLILYADPDTETGTGIFMTVPYRTVPYRTVPYRTVPFRTVPYRTVPYRTVPYRTVPVKERECWTRCRTGSHSRASLHNLSS
jgi:hypothetical protein